MAAASRRRGLVAGAAVAFSGEDTYALLVLALIERVRRTIARHRMLAPGESVLIACSGGPDSVALVHLLRELGHSIAIAHFNHHLRGEESDHDERFVRDLAASLGVTFERDEADVAAEARRRRRNLEDCARLLRLRFLRSVANRLGASRIALGHTADDLVETFLMKLLRGAGRTGLSSIAPARGIFIRPLIELRKREVLDYLEARNLRFVIDASNADMRFLRNRIRAQVLPSLEAVAPHVFERIHSAVRILRCEESVMRELEEKAYIDAMVPAATTRSIAFVRDRLVGLHPALLKRVLRRAAKALGREPGAAAVDGLADWCTDPTGGGPSVKTTFGRMLPGSIAVRRSGDCIILTRGQGVPPQPPTVELPVPGSVAWMTGSTLTAEEVEPSSFQALRRPADDSRECYLDLDRCPPPLTARRRIAGDRYVPVGAPSARHVGKMLSGRHVPLDRARLLPVILAGDKVCWVPGLPVAEGVKVTAETRRLLRISYREDSPLSTG